MSCKRLWGQIAFDITCFVVVMLPTPLLLKYARPSQRGFFCDDQSIRYPYKSDTVSPAALFGGCFVFPICLLIAVEAVCFVAAKRSTGVRSAAAAAAASVPYRVNKTCSVPDWLVTFYKVFGFFVFGMAVAQSLTFIGKYGIGRLRPHFVDVCQPNVDQLNCTSNAYVDGNVCTRPFDRRMSDARQSFPSGHASFSVYAAVFLVFYLESRLTMKFCKMLKPCLQALFIFAAFFASLSRVADNKHHWSDVAAGAVIGIAIGTAAGMYTMKVIKHQHSADESHLPYKIVSEMNNPARGTTL